MYLVNENDKQYRHGDHGPKYLMQGPLSNFGIVRLLPGETVPGHVHRVMEENFFVIEGKVTIKVGGAETEISEGSMLHIDPGEVHVVMNKQDVPAKMVITAAPFKENDKYAADAD